MTCKISEMAGTNHKRQWHDAALVSSVFSHAGTIHIKHAELKGVDQKHPNWLS